MNFVRLALGNAEYLVVPECVMCLQNLGKQTRVYLSGGETITVTGTADEIALQLQGRAKA
jgi:hypothetical protein